MIKSKIIRFSTLFILVLFVNLTVYSIKLDKVILGCDANPLYTDFWPLVPNVWSKLVGLPSALGFIAPKDYAIDESAGQVVRFEPIPGIPTSFQAQVIRLLLPAFFEDEVCILSDMDMIPLSRSYFVDSVASFPSDCFIIYRDGSYKGWQLTEYLEYPMCYCAAKGRIFKEIFNIASIDDIPRIIREWYDHGVGWTTDQQMLYFSVNAWEEKNPGRVIRLGHNDAGRLDRQRWGYNKQILRNGGYIDSHLLRPYSVYEKEIIQLVKDLGISFEN